jgi:hypothetical protein
MKYFALCCVVTVSKGKTERVHVQIACDAPTKQAAIAIVSKYRPADERAWWNEKSTIQVLQVQTEGEILYAGAGNIQRRRRSR